MIMPKMHDETIRIREGGPPPFGFCYAHHLPSPENDRLSENRTKGFYPPLRGNRISPTEDQNNGPEILHTHNSDDKSRDFLRLGLAGYLPAQLADLHRRRDNNRFHLDLRQRARQEERMTVPRTRTTGTERPFTAPKADPSVHRACW